MGRAADFGDCNGPRRETRFPIDENTGETPKGGVMTTTADEVPIRGELSGLGGLYDESVAGTYVINSRVDWEAMWRDQRRGAPALPAELDLEESTGLAVFLGTRRSGGFGVRILRVVRSAEEVVVSAEETMPGRGCMVTMAITNPRHGVILEKVELPVRFEMTRTSVDCE